MSHHDLSTDQLDHLKKLVIEWSGTPHEDRIEDLENLTVEFRRHLEGNETKLKELESRHAEIEGKVAAAAKEARRALELAGEEPETDPRIDELEEHLEALQDEMSELRCASREFAGAMGDLIAEYVGPLDEEEKPSEDEIN